MLSFNELQSLALCRVNAGLLGIVSGHGSLSGSCCLSFIEFPACTDLVTGAIGTKCFH